MRIRHIRVGQNRYNAIYVNLAPGIGRNTVINAVRSAAIQSYWHSFGCGLIITGIGHRLNIHPGNIHDGRVCIGCLADVGHRQAEGQCCPARPHIRGVESRIDCRRVGDHHVNRPADLLPEIAGDTVVAVIGVGGIQRNRDAFGNGLIRSGIGHRRGVCNYGNIDRI